MLLNQIYYFFLILNNKAYESPIGFMMTKTWWRGCSLYEIYPRSFADSNGDGIGDLPGIKNRLPYIKRMGVDAIWLAPFFTSPMADFGYDVSDYCDVDKVFGTLQDFKDLLAEAHSLGLRVLIDLVLSHTSVEHGWFKASQENRTNDKSDWYIWADAGPDGGAPNNWLSVFGGAAWTWHEQRQQFYLHHFLKDQPQLNLYNENVRAALFNVARFWLDLGVDGFRLDAVDFYMHNKELTDNPPTTEIVPPKREFGKQSHIHDMLQKEPTLDFIRAFRNVLNEYSDDRIAVGEVSSQPRPFARIGLYTGPGLLHAAYTLKLAKENITPFKLIKAYEEMLLESPEGCICWSFSNHDASRTMSRHMTGTREHDLVQARMFAVMRQFLPGMDCLYQGEELGLTDAILAEGEKKDPFKEGGRDGSRTPMPWEKSQIHAGFTDASPWLPIPHEHFPLAVDAQEQMPDSLLIFYRQAFGLKHKHSALRDGISTFEQEGEGLTITRSNSDEEVAISLNFGGVPLSIKPGVDLPPFGFIMQHKIKPNFISCSAAAE